MYHGVLHILMIQSTKGKLIGTLLAGKRSKGFPSDLVRRAEVKVAFLDAAISLNDLRTPPSNHLEALKGDRKGQHSIRINQQWRLCFRWEGNHAHDVEIVDYH